MSTRRKGVEAATRRTVVALRQAERLTPADELLVENCYFTARRLDGLAPDVSPAVAASMVRAHLAASRALLGGQDGTSGDDDGLAEMLAVLAGMRGDASEAYGYQQPGRNGDG